jgi:multidrug efflux pump subunit AcrA (membrane-fusion protein)
MQGTILPNNGLVTITAPSSGSIESLTVQEGDSVEQSAPLYTLDVDTVTKAGRRCAHRRTGNARQANRAQGSDD